MFAKKEDKQLEFFGEFSKSPNKRLQRFKLPSIGEEKIIFKISYEKTVFVVIGLILALTLVFSLGVERGKRIGQPAEEQLVTIDAAEPQTEEFVRVQEVAAPAAEETREDNANIIKDEFYTVQTVAYKDLSKAQREREIIKKLGLEAYIVKSKSYFLVCAGNFDDLASTKKELMKLRKNYSDCFIKKVKKEDLY